MFLHTQNARKKPNERGLYLQAICEQKLHEIIGPFIGQFERSYLKIIIEKSKMVHLFNRLL